MHMPLFVSYEQKDDEAADKINYEPSFLFPCKEAHFRFGFRTFRLRSNRVLRNWAKNSLFIADYAQSFRHNRMLVSMAICSGFCWDEGEHCISNAQSHTATWGRRRGGRAFSPSYSGEGGNQYKLQYFFTEILSCKISLFTEMPENVNYYPHEISTTSLPRESCQTPCSIFTAVLFAWTTDGQTLWQEPILGACNETNEQRKEKFLSKNCNSRMTCQVADCTGMEWDNKKQQTACHKVTLTGFTVRLFRVMVPMYSYCNFDNRTVMYVKFTSANKHP